MVFFHFSIVLVHFIFVNLIPLYFIYLLHSTNMLCFLLLYSIRFSHTFLLFICKISSVFSRGISNWMRLLAWEFMLFFGVCTSLCIPVSSFCILLLWLCIVCSNRCAENLVVYRNTFWIGLLLSKEVKQLKIIILTYHKLQFIV